MTEIIFTDDKHYFVRLNCVLLLVVMEQQSTIKKMPDELKQWLAELNSLRTDNIRLKDALSKAICKDVHLSFVEQAERFQQRFVEKDQIMDLLRQDINGLMVRVITGKVTDTDIRQHISLKKDMQQLSEEFEHMKIAFAGFLASGKIRG